MSFDADEMGAAEELNRLWDARSQRKLDTGGKPEMIMLDRLAACDDAPLPDEAFVNRLRATVMTTPAPVSASSHQAVGIVKPMELPWPFASGRRVAIAAALAACLTLIVSAGGGFLRDQTNAPTVASVLASPAGTPTAGPTMTAWLESTAAFSLDREVNLQPEIAVTATGDARTLVAPSTSLTVLETERDYLGQTWFLVKTNDGLVGWLPDDFTAFIGQ
jgi:hypothetical protein